MNARPLATCIMASVAINGGMRKRVIIRPENTPTAPQTAMAARHAPSMAPDEALTPPIARMHHAVTTAASAIRLPTERSMPPVMITIVMPTARMAITAI